MVKVYLKKDTVLNLLARKNKSQNWLAIKLGVSSGFMSQILAKKRALSPEMRERFLGYFEGLVFDELFEISKR